MSSGAQESAANFVTNELFSDFTSRLANGDAVDLRTAASAFRDSDSDVYSGRRGAGAEIIASRVLDR